MNQKRNVYEPYGRRSANANNKSAGRFVLVTMFNSRVIIFLGGGSPERRSHGLLGLSSPPTYSLNSIRQIGEGQDERGSRKKGSRQNRRKSFPINKYRRWEFTQMTIRSLDFETKKIAYFLCGRCMALGCQILMLPRDASIGRWFYMAFGLAGFA